jgi:hypothetical protein
LPIFADTNLGTIISEKNGFARIKECTPDESEKLKCRDEELGPLTSILTQVTTNQCLISKDQYSSLNLPKCPKGKDKIKGLDNTHPAAGVFVTYMDVNAGFVKNFVTEYLKNDSKSKVNIVIPINVSSSLSSHPDLVEVINNPRINIVMAKTSPRTNLWMQDYFQFSTINGKPAIYQLEHIAEAELPLQKRIACEIAKSCNIPYYIPPDMVELDNSDARNMNSGGNLEVLPGGTFLRGIQKTKGHQIPNPTRWGIGSYAQTKAQYNQADALDDSDNRVLDLDISFVKTGHIDELFNVVKTNTPAPCDYAILAADPSLAFKLMESSKAINQNSSIDCSQFEYETLRRKFNVDKSISEKKLKEIYSANCINGESLSTYIKSDAFKIIKATSISDSLNHKEIQKDNIEDLIEELEDTTKCKKPKIISIPVFFRDGKSYVPNLVNGAVQTPSSGASNIILPRTYLKIFDEYVSEELKKIGVRATLVHDLNYHINKGEVHCGTNTARLCQ